MAIDLLEQIHPHIQNAIYPLRMTLSDWRMKEGDIIDASSPSLNDKSWTSIRVPFQWGKYDTTYWFRQSFTVNPQFAGKQLVLLLDFPEALIYLNGKPFHGIDRNHREILICEKAKLGEKFVIAIQAYSGRINNHNTFTFADLAVLDTAARRLHSALNILVELDKLMDHGSQESKVIRDLIRRTLVFLKYFKPNSEEYPNAIRRAYNFLLNTLEVELKTDIPGMVHLIGHSHIDIAWLWTIKETIRKCGRTFSSMLRMMEEFPEFKYSQSQTYLYEQVKIHYPDLYKQIRQRIVEGRWEPIASMYVEADCNIPNGESLIRQIVYAKRFLKNEFGIDSNTIWLPDSFGFNWSLPQILIKSGITNFYTSKLTWNDSTKFPYTSFLWQGIDKSKILTHISPVGLEGQVTPRCILDSGTLSTQQPAPSDILQTFGYGDGGGGPIKDSLEHAIILKSIVGIPSSKFSSVQEFFKKINEYSADLPTWNNELYLETHRGTYTTNAFIKKENRVCENLLYTSELLSSISMIHGKNASSRKYPQQDLEQAWKILLVNQFHDIISGTAISDVYKQSQQDFIEIKRVCNAVIKNSVTGISQEVKKSKKEFRYCLFNQLGWIRNEYVDFIVKSNEKTYSVEDDSGNSIAYQVVGRNKQEVNLLCYIENIPAFGFKNIIIKVQQSSAMKFEEWLTSPHGIDTPFYKVHFDKKGTFNSIYAKHLRRELVLKGKRANQFLTFKDAPKQWEAWNIDSDTEKHHVDIWQLKQIKIIEQGPLRATIHLEFRTENESVLSQQIHFYHQSSRIDFRTSVKWHEKQILMKVSFPFNIKTSYATYEIPFGAIDRITKPRTDFDKAKFEVPAQQWADMSDAKYGISLLNDSKYGYDAKENTLRLTLLRSPHYPDPTNPSLASEDFIDQGDHSFIYALQPHIGDWKKGNITRHAKELNNRVIVFSDIRSENITSFIDVSKTNIIIDSIKKAEESDSIIVRMHESHGVTTDTTINLGIEAASAVECNLLENDEKVHKVVKSKISLKFKPFEIKTLKLVMKTSKKQKKS